MSTSVRTLFESHPIYSQVRGPQREHAIQLFAEAANFAIDLIGPPPVPWARIVGAWKELRDFGDAEEARWHRERPGPRVPMACGRGCAACCTEPALLSAPELFILAEQLDASPRRGEIVETLERQAVAIRALHRKDERYLRRVECGVLAPDKSCGAHDWRPFICHGMSALDASDCVPPSGATLGKPFGRKTGDLVQSVVWNIVSDSLTNACYTLGLDGQPCEVTLGLNIVLHRPELRDKWLRGELALLRGAIPPELRSMLSRMGQRIESRQRRTGKRWLPIVGS